MFVAPPRQESWEIDHAQGWSDSLRFAQSPFISDALSGKGFSAKDFDRDVGIMNFLIDAT